MARLRPIAMIAAAILLTLVASCTRTDYSEAIARHKKLAGQLRDTKLYEAAIEEYEKLLGIETLETSERANVNYLIGRIYFEDLQDYANAAAYYVRAEALDPDGSFVNQASKNLVTSLERMGRMADAQRHLSAATDINAQPGDTGSVMIAKIGDDPVWLHQVERELQKLPPEAQKEFTNRQGKTEFAHQYVATELIYRSARRGGYMEEPRIQRQLDDIRRKLLVDRYVVDKIMPEVSIDSLDVRNYYQAHADDLYNGKPYDSVKAQVFLDYSSEKAQAALDAYLQRLVEAERVEFYDANIR